MKRKKKRKEDKLLTKLQRKQKCGFLGQRLQLSRGPEAPPGTSKKQQGTGQTMKKDIKNATVSGGTAWDVQGMMALNRRS